MIKKLFFSVAAVAALVCSCQEKGMDVVNPVSDGYGVLSLSFVQPESLGTKAVTAYTTVEESESALSKVQLLIFNSATGALSYYEDLASSDFSGGSVSGKQVSLPAATYHVCVYANGSVLSSSEQATYSAYKAKSFDLAANASNFIMTGENDATVTSSHTVESPCACSVTISRHVSRVSLQKITNGAPAALGNVVVKGAWLANVVTNQTVEGNDIHSSWANRFSRNTSPYNSASIMSAPEVSALTYSAISSSNVVAPGANYSTRHNFYAFSNMKAAGTAENAKPVAAAEFSPAMTRLVVKAEFNGADYYYPADIVLDNRNEAHTVEMKISGPGLTDPQGDPSTLSKQYLSVSIAVAAWADGDEYELDY